MSDETRGTALGTPVLRPGDNFSGCAGSGLCSEGAMLMVIGDFGM